ncbi:MAG TPA: hypothetical protein VMR65_03565 [Candidatus Sulfotelmatobacter sp.]|jgi:hypothetical protein|nr:hypothetical protein [Candidatus Sulfotelmatobacter sp.]
MSPARSLNATLGLVFAVAGLVLSAKAAHALACAAPQGYTLEVLVDGRPLTSYAANGTTYVEALKGREYSVRLSNPTGERIAVALAVDGLNVIDAKHTSAREARKWILGPYESIVLDGWQTSAQTARRFVFTNEAGSYGAWLGKTADLGSITAAYFRERKAKLAEPQPLSGSDRDERMRDAGGRNAPPEQKAAEAPSARAKDELAATGIGREVDHGVVQVPFDTEDAPVSVSRVRYEYHDALVKLGVLPRTDDTAEALRRREYSRGFTDSGFAPDPYRGH